MKSSDNQDPHEYHEISDDDITTEKVFDQGTSLLDEMEYMFKSMTTATEQQQHHQQQPPLSPDVENTNKRNELAELSSKLNRKNSSSSGTVSNKSGQFSKVSTSLGLVKY